MCTRSLTRTANTFVLIFVSAILLCSILAYIATWWSISFWNCLSSFDSTTHFSILISKGLCSDSSQAEKTDFDDCKSWATARDESPDGRADEDAVYYQQGGVMCITAMISSAALCLVSASVLKYPNCSFYIRHAQLLLLSILFLLFVFTVALLSETWYTEPSHFAPYDFCNSWYSGPDIGLSAALFNIAASVSVGLFVVFPCSYCIEESERDSLDSFISPLMIPVAVPASPSAPPMEPMPARYYYE